MENNLELSEKIESGEYYAEAREWYLKKYIYSFIERSYLIILCGGLIFLMFEAYEYYESMQPIYKQVPVQIRIEDSAEEFSRMIYLGDKKKDFDINKQLIKYFSAKFVEAIESYDYNNDFKKLRINLNFVKNLANDNIYNYYTDRVSLRSRNSVILKYKRNLIKKVNIDFRKIEVGEEKKENKVQEIFGDFESKHKSYVATANFEIEDITKKGTTKSNWIAKIKLKFDPIEYDFEKRDFNDVNFKVTSYESRKI